MNNRRNSPLSLICVLVLSTMFGSLPALADEAGGSRIVTFSLSSVGYKFELPDGYCTPADKARELAKAVAALDPANMTHLTITLCTESGDNTALSRWGMLKTPRSSIGKRIPTRSAFITEFKSKIKHQSLWATATANASTLANKTHKEVLGSDAQVRMHMEPLDADDYAGYMGGTMALELVAGQKELIACVGAMTIVKGHVFFYYKYSQYGAPSDIADLLAQVKMETRRFVIGNPN